MFRLGKGAAALVVCLFVGCVSKKVEVGPELAPPLMLSQNSSGEVFLSWKSDPGKRYTVYFRETDKAPWEPLPAGTHVRGTGGSLSLRDKQDPRKPPRLYRLRVEQ